jgi:hypothetical protein
MIQDKQNKGDQPIQPFNITPNYTSSHEHNGVDTPRISIRNIIGYVETRIQTISSAPSGTPANNDQIKLYVNGSTYRIYIYDFTNSVWHYINLTA